jgi:hypothetical protein
MPSSYFLLKRALDAGARLRAVVIDCQDAPVMPGQEHEQAEGLRSNRRNWPELLSFGESLDLAWTARDADFFADVTVARIVPSYRARFEIRQQVRRLLAGEENALRVSGLAFLRNWAQNRGGALLASSSSHKAAEPLPADASELRQDFSKLRNPLTEMYSKRLLSLAAARGVSVFWVVPPRAPTREAFDEQIGVNEYVDALAKSALANHPRLVVIDGRKSGYPADAFADEVHLNGRGAVAFSTGVATILDLCLTAESPTDRWVRLPAFDNCQKEAPPGLEPLDVSTAIVSGTLKGIRR